MRQLISDSRVTCAPAGQGALDRSDQQGRQLPHCGEDADQRRDRPAHQGAHQSAHKCGRHEGAYERAHDRSADHSGAHCEQRLRCRRLVRRHRRWSPARRASQRRRVAPHRFPLTAMPATHAGLAGAPARLTPSCHCAGRSMACAWTWAAWDASRCSSSTLSSCCECPRGARPPPEPAFNPFAPRSRHRSSATRGWRLEALRKASWHAVPSLMTRVPRQASWRACHVVMSHALALALVFLLRPRRRGSTDRGGGRHRGAWQ